MKWLLSAIFIFFSLGGQSQEILRGKVYSGHFKSALRKAYVRSGMKSDKTENDGSFELEITPYEPLQISHVGYDNLSIPYEEIRGKRNFEFYLTPASSSITKTIKNEEFERIHEGKFEVLRDYTFMNDTLLILSYMNSQSGPSRDDKVYRNCALSFFDYGELVERIILPDNVNRIRTDVRGGIYLVGGSFCKYLNRRDNQLKVEDFDYEVFKQQVDPIFGAGDNAYYYKEFFDVIPMISIVEYDFTTKESRIVKFIKNREYFRFINKDFAMLSPPEKKMAVELEEETNLNQRLFAPYLRSFYLDRNTALPWVKGFVEGDSLLVFDYQNRHVYIENVKNGQVDSLGIYQFDIDKEKLLDIIRAEGSQAYYVLHDRAGVRYLRRLDIKTMALGRPFQLFYPFVRRIRIIDGYVYYLHTPPKEIGEKLLLREKLIY
jgi:hypothetical protein